jgi:hypothetical protein
LGGYDNKRMIIGGVEPDEVACKLGGYDNSVASQQAKW